MQTEVRRDLREQVSSLFFGDGRSTTTVLIIVNCTTLCNALSPGRELGEGEGCGGQRVL